MEKQILRKLAEEAIERKKGSKFTRGEAFVSFCQEKPFPEDFPIQGEYLGFHKGKYVYNLSAKSILQWLDRCELEWDV
jgi:hypothetical protein